MKILQNRYIKFLLFTIPSILAIVFIILFINKSNEFYQAENKYESNIEKFNIEKKELNAKFKEKEKLIRMSRNNITLNNYSINKMKEKGLMNPVEDIISDLQKHRELIPYKGVLGGTMAFYDKNEIWVLTDKWVFAYFDDGHISGYLLLQYFVHDNGKITWQKIAAMRS